MAYWIVTTSLAGCMPDPESNHVYQSDADNPLADVLAYIRDEVETFGDAEYGVEWPAEDRAIRWARLLDIIEEDIADARSQGSGGVHAVGYTMPDGYVIEAVERTRDELVAWGYVPGEDFDDGE